MKATIEIPDELYRRVKAKSALEGRPIRAVTEELFRRYVMEGRVMEGQATDAERPDGDVAEPVLVQGEPVPAWFGILRDYARRVPEHDMEEIRRSIARGIAAERAV